MPKQHEERRRGFVLVGLDSTQRLMIQEACERVGVSVVAVSAVREVERWPAGGIVITDIAHLTPLWLERGAEEVIVLVDDAHEGIGCLNNGATRWLKVPATPEAITAMVLVLAARNGREARNPAERNDR